MSARIIDGKLIAEQTRNEVAQAAQAFRDHTGVIPHLAAVLVGHDPASEVYVRNKERACQKAGLASTLHRLAGTTTQNELLDLVQQLNADSTVARHSGPVASAKAHRRHVNP